MLKGIVSLFDYCKDKCYIHGFREIRRQTLDIKRGLVATVFEVEVMAQNVQNSQLLLNKWNALWNDGFIKTYTLKTCPFNTIFSLELNGEIIGVCGYNLYGNVVHLHSLAIAKKHLSKGYARGFCRFVVDFSTPKGFLLLGVAITSPKWLFKFYHSLGFEYVEDGDARFEDCTEYKWPRVFSSDTIQWMAKC